jgi:hypothetical protein
MYHRVIVKPIDNVQNFGYRCWAERAQNEVGYVFPCGVCGKGDLGPKPTVGQKCSNCKARVTEVIITAEAPKNWSAKYTEEHLKQFTP